MAEVELITATVATLSRLGLGECVIRVNDRRLLTSALGILGFAPDEFDGVLVTVDKLDKIAHDGVAAELRERGFTAAAVDALETFFRRPMTMEFLPFGEAAIRKFLPEGVDQAAVAELAAIGEAVNEVAGSAVVQFDPWLVRGMGYYTGAIFEVAHPSIGHSLGGGGRYDGMIGRFLGTDVPAAGFSLGFERLVDLVDLPASSEQDAAALVHDADVAPTALVALQSALIARGQRVRLERKPRNLAPLMAQLEASGFTQVAFVTATTTLETMEFRPIG